MSDTTTSATLIPDKCDSCRGSLAVIAFRVPHEGQKITLAVCAMCLVGIVDQALDTRYTASLQVGLINRELGRTAVAKRAEHRARKKVRDAR